MENAQATRTSMDPDDLRRADEQILDVLSDGRATKGLLIDETDFSRNTIYHRLQVLEVAGHVTTVHEPTRLFELASEPRTESETE